MDLKEFINKLQERLDDGESEIFIQVGDTQFDFDIEHQDEIFDGFYTSYPPCCLLKPREDENGL